MTTPIQSTGPMDVRPMCQTPLAKKGQRKLQEVETPTQAPLWKPEKVDQAKRDLLLSKIADIGTQPVSAQANDWTQWDNWANDNWRNWDNWSNNWENSSIYK